MTGVMKMRTEIESWIARYNTPEEIPSGTHWLKTLDDEEGQPCLRTYALNKTKKKGIRVKEVVREYLNEDFIKVHGDLYFCGAAGYRVVWEKREYYGYYLPTETDNHWYDYDRRLGICAEELYTDEQVEQIFSKYIPYFQWTPGMCLMEYASRYRDFASAELLAKAGYGYLVMDKRVLKLSKDGKKKLIRWLSKNGDYVKEHRPLYKDISMAVKKDWSMEKFYYEQTIDAYEKQFKERDIVRTRLECEEVYRYLNSPTKVQRIGLHDYIDYLVMAKELGYDMTLKSTLYPLNCALAHDTLSSTKKAKESAEINEKLLQISSVLQKYQLSANDLKIVIPTSQKDFVEWGKKLGICVGTYGYDKKMIEGRCIILMVYVNDQPLECCELVKKERGETLQIEQLRGQHNQDSERHKDCEKLVNQFIHNVGRNWRVQNAA